LHFSEALTILLNEPDTQCDSLGTAKSIMLKLRKAQKEVEDLKNQLKCIKRRMNADLAFKIKRHVPALNVGVNRLDGCKIGYKDQCMSFDSDIENNMWNLSSPDIMIVKKFKDSHSDDLSMKPNLNNVVQTICNFFTDHFESMGESVVGVGTLIIEGKLGSLKDLVSYRDSAIPIVKIQSRLARLQ
jgi:hypothetical protein